jgi:hypothetical protein
LLSGKEQSSSDESEKKEFIQNGWKFISPSGTHAEFLRDYCCHEERRRNMALTHIATCAYTFKRLSTYAQCEHLPFSNIRAIYE